MTSAATHSTTAHVGVFVLDNRQLWDVVTSFMLGYPLVVHRFCTVLYNRASALECIEELKMSAGVDWDWEPNLVRLALERPSSHLQADARLTPQPPLLQAPCPYTAKDLMYHIKRGNLKVVQWLCERMLPSITQDMVDEAARRGHVDVLCYLYKCDVKRCGRATLEEVASKGNVDIVGLILLRQTERGDAAVRTQRCSRGRPHTNKLQIGLSWPAQ